MMPKTYFACSEKAKGERADKTGGVPHHPGQSTPGEPPEVRPPLPVIRQAPASSPPESPRSPRAKREASSTSFRSLYKKGTQCSMEGGFWIPILGRRSEDRRVESSPL